MLRTALLANIGLLGMIGLLLIGCASATKTEPVIAVASTSRLTTLPIATNNAAPLAEQQTLLDASTQIIMQRTLVDGTVTQGQGIATLVTVDGRQQLVTHNHWGDFLGGDASVTFFDAAGNVIVETDAKIVRSLTQFADAGTLILTPLPELARKLTAVSGHALGALNDGEMLWGVHQVSAETRGLRLMQHTITSQALISGSPAMQLRNVDGLPTIHGDSGGGLFFEGRFIGNMWSTCLTASDRSPTALSIAALYVQPTIAESVEVGTQLDSVDRDSAEIYSR